MSQACWMLRREFFPGFSGSAPARASGSEIILEEKMAKTEEYIKEALLQYFWKNRKLLDVLFASGQEKLLLDLIISMLGYDEADENITAYMKIAWANFLFGLMSEWYKRGMQEKPKKLTSDVQSFFAMMWQMDESD